jgi:ribosomal protein S6
MRPYDVMLILEPTLEESAIQAVVNRSTDLLQSGGGTVNRVDKWGRRRLAYEVIRHKIVRVPRHAGGRVRPPAAVEEAAAGPARTS